MLTWPGGGTTLKARSPSGVNAPMLANCGKPLRMSRQQYRKTHSVFPVEIQCRQGIQQPSRTLDLLGMFARGGFGNMQQLDLSALQGRRALIGGDREHKNKRRQRGKAGKKDQLAAQRLK